MSDLFRSSRHPMVLEFGRDIDRANAEPFGTYLCQAIDWARRDVVVDVSDVAFIHSRGLAMMTRVDQHARTLHHTVTWKGAQPWLTRVLEITGLDSAPAVADRQFA
jgi:anti-anti-sigma factor